MYEETAKNVRLIASSTTFPALESTILGQPAEGPDFIGGGIYWLHVWLYSRTGALVLHSSLNSDVKCS